MNLLENKDVYLTKEGKRILLELVNSNDKQSDDYKEVGFLAKEESNV